MPSLSVIEGTGAQLSSQIKMVPQNLSQGQQDARKHDGIDFLIKFSEEPELLGMIVIYVTTHGFTVQPETKRQLLHWKTLHHHE